MPFDDDGFRTPATAPPSVAIKRPPVTAEVPKTFEGCINIDEAIARAMNELGQSASINQDGFDTMYRRLANGMIVILAKLGDITP
jgi:hypothetical protein